MMKDFETSLKEAEEIFKAENANAKVSYSATFRAGADFAKTYYKKLRTLQMAVELFFLIAFCAFLAFGCTSLPVEQAPPPTPGKTNIDLSESACAKYYWKNRGYAPVGFLKGVIESYRQAEEALPIGSPSRDALAYYSFVPGEEKLKTYTFLIGLGMRESNGNYSLGRDYTAKGPQSSLQAESGAWQFSYDSIGSHPRLKQIYEFYKANPGKCMVATYAEGLCDPEKRNCDAVKKVYQIRYDGYISTPQSGYEFQKFMRACPAAAAEYAAIMIRVNRNHFGPIVRNEVEYRKECEEMLRGVK